MAQTLKFELDRKSEIQRILAKKCRTKESAPMFIQAARTAWARHYITILKQKKKKGGWQRTPRSSATALFRGVNAYVSAVPEVLVDVHLHHGDRGEPGEVEHEHPTSRRVRGLQEP